MLLANIISFGQLPLPKTEVVLIGTIHQGNQYFNHKTLYNIFKKYNPDIILWEQSSHFKRVFGLRTATFLKIWKPGIEQLSLQKYSRLNKKVNILPFDTTIVSRKKYIQRRAKEEQAFFTMLNIAQKSLSDSTVYADYANKRNNYYHFIADTGLQRINKPDVIEMTRTLYHLEEKFILRLGRKYITDSQLVKQQEDDFTFWIARNDYMVKQIIKYIDQFPGKRIIILTGLNHKYYLQEKLLKQKDSAIKMIELEGD